MSGVRRSRTVTAGVLERLASVGADPGDDEDTRANKALLVLISVLILPVALLWSILYLAFGSPVGYVPLVYFAVLLGAILVFARTRSFAQLLLVAQIAILLAPTLSMIPLGRVPRRCAVSACGASSRRSVRSSSATSEERRSLVRRVGRRVPRLRDHRRAARRRRAEVPEWFTSTMLALNITVGGTIVFTLLATFAGQRRAALAALREEQAASREPAAQRPASLDRRQAQGGDADDRRPVQLGVHPVRRCRRLHAVGGTPAGRRGRRRPRPPVQSLRHAGRAVRRREDQDDRGLLHGRLGRPDAAPGPRAGARPDGTRHAGGDVRRSTSSDTSDCGSASASTPVPWSPA